MPTLTIHYPQQARLTKQDRRSMQCNFLGLKPAVLPYCVVHRCLVSDKHISLIMHCLCRSLPRFLSLLQCLSTFPTRVPLPGIQASALACIHMLVLQLPASSVLLLRQLHTHPSGCPSNLCRTSPSYAARRSCRTALTSLAIDSLLLFSKPVSAMPQVL